MPGYVRARGKRTDGSTKWQARWRHPDDPSDRGRREKVFRAKREAERWLSEQDADAFRGTYTDPRRGDRPFRAVADAWRASWVGLEPKTRAGYASILSAHLIPEFGDRRVSTITPERVEAYVRRLSDAGMKPGTVRSVYAALRAALNTAVRLRMIAVNPCVGVKLPRAAKTPMLFLSPEQVRALAEGIDPHFRVLIYTAAYTGMRAGELGALRRKRVDLLRGRLTVEEALKDLTGAKHLASHERCLIFGPTKTHARRSIVLPGFLRDLLNEHLTASPGGPDDLVFTTTTGSPIRQTNFLKRNYKPAVRACLPAELHALRFHDLRHTCAALLIAQGAHPKAIQEILGHESITMTLDQYGHLLPGLGDDLAARLDAAHTSSAQPSSNVVPIR